MLEDISSELFADRVGERFSLCTDGRELEAELVEATVLTQTPLGRVPFSLVFQVPGDEVLPQSIYRFAHQELGEFEIFVVPIGRDETGVRYQAVFT